MNIYIEKETELPLDIDYKQIIEAVVLKALDMEGCPYEAEVNVVLTDNENIALINEDYRQIAKETDVLSFPMVDYSKPGDFSVIEELSENDCFNPETGELVLGDIIISVEKVEEQAESFGHSKERELGFLTAHSMLHLFGYDHMEESEAKEMEEHQEKILEALELRR